MTVQAPAARARRAGPVALAGSGEFLPVMEPVDRALLEGRPARAAFLPTAAALEGDERTAYWLDLGRRHYESMGVEPIPVPVLDRDDAQDVRLARLVEGVGLIYLSGGNPHYLSTTLRDSVVWRAILESWQSGAALAGCSAGAMALTCGAPREMGVAERGLVEEAGAPGGERGGRVEHGRHGGPGGRRGRNGLGVVDGLAVVPHFDRMERWRQGIVGTFVAWCPPGAVLVGIDEETALVTDDAVGGSWRVEGVRSAWVLEREGRDSTRKEVPAGSTLELGDQGIAP